MDKPKFASVVFSAFALLFFLGNGLIPISDPVEVNYAMTAKEMLESGDYVSPRIYGNPWFDKPVFFYWEILAAFKFIGITDFAARFFPALMSLLGLFLIYIFAGVLYGKKVGIYSVIILGTSLIYWCLSKLIITDTTLFFFMNGALVAFYLAYSQNIPKLYYLAYLFAGLSVLTKGPVGLAVPGAIILLFLLWDKNIKALLKMKLLSGLALFLLVCAPWYIAMTNLHGDAFIDTFLGVHNYLRATVSEHPKWDVWYYYTGIFFIGAFPWCFAPIAALYRRIKAKNFSLTREQRFLIVWAVFIPVLFQCMATKYPTYSFPAFFPVAILIALFLKDREKLFKGVAIFAFLFSVAAISFITVKGEENGHFAGKPIGIYLKDHATKDDVILSMGDYRASIPFYSGKIMYQLDTKERIEERENKGLDWSKKQVMPFISYDEIPWDNPIYLVVEEHKVREFDKLKNSKEWKLIMTSTEKDKVIWLYKKEKIAK